MAHTYTQNLIHLVFSTKERQPSIHERVQSELWKYIVGIGANHKIPIVTVGGMRDHIHVLFDLPKTIALAKAVQTLKANSSRWMREHDRRFSWQVAYGAFGVSESGRNSVIEYIENQAEHHKKRSFEEEYLALLKKHNIQYDAKWVLG
jgi:REP element-mobilizing transposase RayT